jgi:integrase
MMKPFRVKPYKHPRLKFVVEGRQNGKRSREFFDNKRDAELRAKIKNIELMNQGIEGATFDTVLRVMAQQCTNTLRPFNKTIEDATRFYVKHLEATKKSVRPAKLIDELLAAKKADGLSERYVQDLANRLVNFAMDFPNVTVAEITIKDIDDWLRALDVAPITRNNFRRLLIVLFNFAVQRGYAESNPAKATEKAKVVGEAPGILTVQQTARLLEVASPELLPYLAIGAFAGLRRAELERLDWSEIDFDSGLIEVTAKNAKTARRRHVTMQPNLREWLLPLRKHGGNITPDDFREQFDKAREAAGIKVWPNNALRHSFASYHLAHFNETALLALQMGHTSADMIFNHYRELVKPKVAASYWNIVPAITEKVVQIVAHAE